MRAPPFCPNPECELHNYDAAIDAGTFWILRGTYTTLVSGVVQRFRCSRCGKGFSERTCSIDYYAKKILDYREILRATTASESCSSIARHLGCSSSCIMNRQDRLGRNGLALQARLLSGFVLSEDLCADGFESFDRSQFFPNAINILVGARSQFLFGATHATLRRKGRMKAAQRRKRDAYDVAFTPPKGGLTRSFSRLLETIDPIWDRTCLPALVLRTDEHPVYPRAIRMVPSLRLEADRHVFVHDVYSSKLPRTLGNPLFPVNYYDRELRKDIASFRRESTCFTRNVSNGLLRFTHHLVWHNYMKPHRIVSCSRQPETHACVAGIVASKIVIEMERLFCDRAFLSHQRLSDDSVRTWLKEHRTPLKVKPDYCQAFVRQGQLQGSRNY
jgi:hypothetical protein